MALSPLESKLPWTYPLFKELFKFGFSASATPVSFYAFDVVCSQLGFVHAGLQADVTTSVF